MKYENRYRTVAIIIFSQHKNQPISFSFQPVRLSNDSKHVFLINSLLSLTLIFLKSTQSITLISAIITQIVIVPFLPSFVSCNLLGFFLILSASSPLNLLHLRKIESITHYLLLIFNFLAFKFFNLFKKQLALFQII